MSSGLKLCNLKSSSSYRRIRELEMHVNVHISTVLKNCQRQHQNSFWNAGLFFTHSLVIKWLIIKWDVSDKKRLDWFVKCPLAMKALFWRPGFKDSPNSSPRNDVPYLMETTCSFLIQRLTTEGCWCGHSYRQPTCGRNALIGQTHWWILIKIQMYVFTLYLILSSFYYWSP